MLFRAFKQSGSLFCKAREIGTQRFAEDGQNENIEECLICIARIPKLNHRFQITVRIFTGRANKRFGTVRREVKMLCCAAEFFV